VLKNNRQVVDTEGVRSAGGMSGHDGVLGAMLGLAVGDALGAPLEGAPRRLARRAAERGLEMAGSGRWAAGQWTDDTALTLELAESTAEYGLLDTDDLARRYIRWATSDGRGIGRTTRAALVGAVDAAGARRRAVLFHARTGLGASNGSVMRCAPIGLAARDLEQSRQAAAADARLTHGHPAAARASAALCAALLALRRGDDPGDAALAEVRGVADLERALVLAADEDREPLAALATGRAAGACWTTLAIGLCALTWIGEYEQGVTWAISLGGDSDTNAAVAGALLGYACGARAIPQRWLKPLARRDRLERAARALAERACSTELAG
jgi:ADP-ribosyl-[dinitrogen reductase] hydrolase